MRALFTTMLALVLTASIHAKQEDVTSKITNADFKAGLEGWSLEGTHADSLVLLTPDNAPSTLYSKADFNLCQTLTGLEDGIYMVQVSAIAGEFPLNRPNYNSYLYANENAIPIMNTTDDLLPKDKAIDQENCFITPETEGTDSWLNLAYYIPHSQMGACYAFKGGRYVNTVVTEVKGGHLTVGIQSKPMMRTDKMVFGNMKLYYLGSIAEAESEIDQAMGNMIRNMERTANTDIMSTPYYINYDKSLRSEVSALVAKMKKASTPAEKLDMLQEGKRMLDRVYKNQMAYWTRKIETDNAHIWFTFYEDDDTAFEEAYKEFQWKYMLGELDLENDTEFNAVKATVTWAEFTATGIDAPLTTSTSTLYDLQGRKIEAKPGKGIYIKDGKKYMMK